MTPPKALAALFLMTSAGASPPADVQIEVANMRNAKGVIHACLTRHPSHFPDCSDDPAALKHSVDAADPIVRFAGVAPGRYAVTVFHDENRNGRLDMFLGVPREGFGFSRNPVIRFGPPKFQQVGIDLGAGQTRLAVRMQYIL